MANGEMEKFKDFLGDSFKETLCRELRLSNTEIEYLKSRYPNTIIERLSKEESQDEKHWYLIKFLELPS